MANQSSPRCFLDILPPEIRRPIFEHVLSSPDNGRIVLRPKQDLCRMRFEIVSSYNGKNEKKISLSFLRTCKQIYAECQGIFWRCNTLSIRYDNLFGFYPADVRSQVQSVEIEFDFLEMSPGDPQQSLPLEHSLTDLYGQANLERLTIHAVSPSGFPHMPKDPHTALLQLLTNSSRGTLSMGLGAQPGDTVFDEQVSILRAAGGRHGYLSHLERTFVFHTGEPIFNDEGYPMRNFDGIYGDPDDMMRSLACAFRGTFIVDDIVRCVDGEKMEDLFVREAPSPLFFYKKDLRIVRLGEMYADAIGADRGQVINEFRRWYDVLDGLFGNGPDTHATGVRCITTWVEEGKLSRSV